MNYTLDIEKPTIVNISDITNYRPFVFSTLISTTTIAEYWEDVFLSSYDTLKIKRNIISVIIQGATSYTKEGSLADCISTEESFYFADNTQRLYVHYQHDINPFSITTEYIYIIGFSDHDVEYIDDILYKPLLTSFPVISQTADLQQAGIISYSDASFRILNDTVNGVGIFDTDPLLVGMECRLKRDSTIVWVGRISSYTTTLDTLTLNAVDKRKQLQIDHPTETFSVLDSYDSGWNTRKELLPDGYGDVEEVPAYPITDDAGTITFRWGEAVTSITQVYVESGGIVVAVSHADFSTDGTFTLTDALCARDGGDPTKGILNAFVTGKMRNYDNPADIIADMNSRLLGIAYNSANYNTTEWASEKSGLADISLYLNETRKLTDWIELMQTGSDVVFRYEDIEKRTIRLDNPTRSVAETIQAIEIRNNDMPIDNNADLYATDALVKYAKNWRTGAFSQVTNDDYYDTSFLAHRIAKTFRAESLLTAATDAERKALLIMDDMSKIRPIFTIIVDYQSYQSPRIYDIITVVFSFGDREYFGSQRCQVVGISPIPETDEYELTLRQRDDSSVY